MCVGLYPACQRQQVASGPFKQRTASSLARHQQGCVRCDPLTSGHLSSPVLVSCLFTMVIKGGG